MNRTPKRPGTQQNRMQLSNLFRQLWEQHVMWTRSFIISVAHSLPDLDAVTQRLLRNPADFARQLLPYYGEAAAQQFQNLLEEHLMIGAELVKASKAGNKPAASDARTRWYRNADEIAALLARVNPYWNQREWQRMLYAHLASTEQEAGLRLTGKYAEDVAIYEIVENEALHMADMMSNGTARAFPL